MKIKTSELIGGDLDAMVAQIVGQPIVWLDGAWWVELQHDDRDLELGLDLPTHAAWNPSSNPAVGHAFIEQEGIGTKLSRMWLDFGDVDHKWAGAYPGGHMATGPTILVAGLRCMVAKNLGDEVEIVREPEQEGDDGTEDHDTADRNRNRDGLVTA